MLAQRGQAEGFTVGQYPQCTGADRAWLDNPHEKVFLLLLEKKKIKDRVRSFCKLWPHILLALLQ